MKIAARHAMQRRGAGGASKRPRRRVADYADADPPCAAASVLDRI